MKEIALIIILFSLIKLIFYGKWNLQNEKNIPGMAGCGIEGGSCL